MDKILAIFASAAAVTALFFAIFTAHNVLKQDEGNDLMKQISAYIKQGANAYLKRQYKISGGKLIEVFECFCNG